MATAKKPVKKTATKKRAKRKPRTVTLEIPVRPEPPKIYDKYTLLWDVGDSAYLRTDPNQNEHLVTAVCVRESGITYCLGCNGEESWHYAFEMTYERGVIKATTG